MRIGIIGTGNVGRALGGAFVRAGHEVTFAARDADKTRRLAAELGASAAGTPAEAAHGADVIVLAVPFGAAGDVARQLAGSATGKIVIDVTNPLKADMSGLVTDGGPSAAERIAGELGGASVVKAFNTLLASVQADPLAHGVRVDSFFATDDERARSRVHDLIASIGFRPVYVGPLISARELEAMAWLNMRLQMLAGGDWQSAFVLVGVPAAATAAPESAASAR